MSISRGCGRSETSRAIATSSSVVLPRAERTATTSLPASFAATIRPAARLMRSASATDVPPNFMTMVSAMAPKDTLGPAMPRLQIPPFGPTALAVIAGLGIAAAVQDFRTDDPGRESRADVPEAGGGGTGPRERTSFLARLIPPPPERVEGPVSPNVDRGPRGQAADRAQGRPALPARLRGPGPDGADLQADAPPGPRRDRLREPQLPRPAADRVDGRRGKGDRRRRGARAAVRDGLAGGRRVLGVPRPAAVRGPVGARERGRGEGCRHRGRHVTRRARLQRGARACDRRRHRRRHRRARRACVLRRPGAGGRLRERRRARVCRRGRDGGPQALPGARRGRAGARGRADAHRPDGAGVARARPRGVRGGVRCGRARGADLERLVHHGRLRHPRIAVEGDRDRPPARPARVRAVSPSPTTSPRPR